MSIETLILQHTQALLENTEAVKLLTLAVTGNIPKKGDDKPAAEKAPAKVEEKKEKSKADEIDPEAAAAHAAESVYDREGDNEYDPERNPVPYETVRALVLKLAPTQREKIKALNAGYGLTNAKDMLSNPEDFTSVKDQDKLEAYYADLQALEG